jgi:hypothetical protein
MTNTYHRSIDRVVESFRPLGPAETTELGPEYPQLCVRTLKSALDIKSEGLDRDGALPYQRRVIQALHAEDHQRDGAGDG